MVWGASQTLRQRVEGCVSQLGAEKVAKERAERLLQAHAAKALALGIDLLRTPAGSPPAQEEELLQKVQQLQQTERKIESRRRLSLSAPATPIGPTAAADTAAALPPPPPPPPVGWSSGAMVAGWMFGAVAATVAVNPMAAMAAISDAIATAAL